MASGVETLVFIPDVERRVAMVTLVPLSFDNIVERQCR